MTNNNNKEMQNTRDDKKRDTEKIPSCEDWRFDEGKLYTMVYLYTAIMHGWQIRRLPTDGKDRFELLKTGRTSLVNFMDWKALPKMMYLYVAIMQGWQTRLLENEGKHSFELLRGHMGMA